MLVCVVFSCLAILRIEGCLKQYPPTVFLESPRSWASCSRVWPSGRLWPPRWLACRGQGRARLVASVRAVRRSGGVASEHIARSGAPAASPRARGVGDFGCFGRLASARLCSRFIKGGAVETGCSGFHYIISSFAIHYYTHPLYPPSDCTPLCRISICRGHAHPRDGGGPAPVRAAVRKSRA